MENYVEDGSALVVTSDMASRRFDWQSVKYTALQTKARHEYILDETQTFQEILGFGGAFTDSAGHNINLMENPTIIDKIIGVLSRTSLISFSPSRLFVLLLAMISAIFSVNFPPDRSKRIAIPMKINAN